MKTRHEQMVEAFLTEADADMPDEELREVPHRAMAALRANFPDAEEHEVSAAAMEASDRLLARSERGKEDSKFIRGMAEALGPYFGGDVTLRDALKEAVKDALLARLRGEEMPPDAARAVAYFMEKGPGDLAAAAIDLLPELSVENRRVLIWCGLPSVLDVEVNDPPA